MGRMGHLESTRSGLTTGGITRRTRTWMLILLLTAMAGGGAAPAADAPLSPPSEAQRTQALGPLDDATALLKAALDPGAFIPMGTPGPGDWQMVFHEPGQTFEDFTRENHPRPDAIHTTIYLQPLGDFPADRSPDLEKLRRYVAAFFMTPANILPARPFHAGDFQERFNATVGARQLRTMSILRAMLQDKPRDAFAVVDVTMFDLYPQASWNFVFGQSSPGQGVGVFSFARYTPAENRALTPLESTLLLRRSCAVLSHEILHLFGVHHCIYYHCIINGSNSLDEADGRPLHVCPVDLRKLQEATGCDVLQRYQQLKALCDEWQLTDEGSWLAAEIHRLAAPAK